MGHYRARSTWHQEAHSSKGQLADNWYDDLDIAYQPKGAVNLSASYVNLVNPGTYDAAPGVAPSFGAGGWMFNGSTQYLTTGVNPNIPGWSMIVQWTGLTTADDRTIAGVYQGGVTKGFLIQSRSAAVRSYNGAPVDNAPALAAGNYAVVGKNPYRDGVLEGNTIGAGGADATIPIFIGALNLTGAPSQFASVTIAAFGLKFGTLTDVAATAAAMAAL